MSLQGALLRKLSKTFVTLERFLPSVNPHMSLEMSLLITRKRTCFTKPILLIFVNGLFMSLKMTHLVCNVVTQIATELFFFINRFMNIYMVVQMVLGFKSFVALITFERSQYVYLFCVHV